MTFKKLSWVFKRHPFLYKTRFKLLSKNTTAEEIQDCSYNLHNAKEDIPSVFKEINERIFRDYEGKSDFDRVKHLSIWLKNSIKGGPGLSEPSDSALEIMLSGRGGVCSDMVQVFNNFCVINDTKVREWGNTRAPFNKFYGGHSFNEFYCETLDKWILIDVYNSLLFYNNKKVPLSVIELYDMLRNGYKVDYESFNTEFYIPSDTVFRNFLDPNTIPFLICNYSNKTYDNYLHRFRPQVPVFAIHFILFVMGSSYEYHFPMDDYKRIFS